MTIIRFKNYFEDIKSRKSSSILMKIHIVFQYQSKIIRVIELKKKRINLFAYSCNIFTVIDLNEHINTILNLLRNFSDV